MSFPNQLASIVAIATVCAYGNASAQMTHIDTIDLSATVAEANALEINRHFGEIYVTDFNMGGRPLHVYDLDFQHLGDMEIGPPDYSVAQGVFREPGSGDFFFTTHDGTINRYDSNGNFITSFAVGGAGNGLVYDPADNTLWVAHWDQEIVEHRMLDGALISSFDPSTLGSLVGVALDPVSQTLFISGNNGDEVHEYDLTGNFIQIVLEGGQYPVNGLGIAYDCVTGRLYYGGQAAVIEVFEDASRPTCQANCAWDLDADGNVGTGDLILLLGSWGDPYDTQDLIELLGAWGPCPK